MSGPRFVIAGGGVAAVSAAETLRREGFDGQVVVVGAEELPGYERPPLSKQWLLGDGDADELLVRDRDWYREQEVQLLTGTRVLSVDCAQRRLTLSSGEQLGYDRLLVATGGRPRRLPGVDSDRVLCLRDVADARRLREVLVPGERLVVLGGGFVGCELAATARGLGMEVTILEMLPTLLQRALGAELGQVFADIHRSHGVELRTGERVVAVDETGDGLVVTTERDGLRRSLECGSMVVAVGMERATELLDGSPVRCVDGVLVDEYAQSSVPEVFAAGDVAATHHAHYHRRLRVEHHDNALRQGALAARNMLGERIAYQDIPWFWSDQYEHNLQLAGSAEGYEETVLRGSVEQRSFSVFYLTNGQVVAVFALDRAKDVLAGRRLIASGRTVTADELKDESVDLRRLVPRTAARTATRTRTAGRRGES